MARSTSKVLGTLLWIIALTFLSSFNMTVLAAEPTTIEVKDETTFSAAITQINAAASGEFVIKLTDDIVLATSKEYTLEKNITTILGGGHTIYLESKSAKIYVRGDGTESWGDIVLNLGSPGGSDTLTIKGTKADGTAVNSRSKQMVQCQDATLNMYNGVTISDSTGNLWGSALFVSGNFNMYGGSITRNTTTHYYGGAGIAFADGTINMYGGSITNNKSSSSWGSAHGGGILIMPCESNGKCIFNMYGGTISNNTAKIGGGISAGAYSSDAVPCSTYLNFYGGKIVDNSASVFGGGVVVSEGYDEGTKQFDIYTTIDPKVSVPADVAAILGVSDAEYGDSVTITGNTNSASGIAENLAIATDLVSETNSEYTYDKITVGDLTSTDTNVGITMEYISPEEYPDYIVPSITDIAFTENYRLNNSGTHPNVYFTSDNPDYIIEDWYADGAAEPSEARLSSLDVSFEVTFETMADAGYYSETRNSEDRSGIVLLNVLIANYDSIKGNIVEYGLYVTADRENAQEVTVVSDNVEQLGLDSGYYHVIVNKISSDDFDAVFSGVPFVRIDADGDLETTDDRSELKGDTAVATSVSTINKWLGPVNE